MKILLLSLFLSFNCFASYIIPNGSVTQIKLAQRPESSVATLGQIAMGPATAGPVSTSATSFTNMTGSGFVNPPISLVTNGRPIVVMLTQFSFSLTIPPLISTTATTGVIQIVGDDSGFFRCTASVTPAAPIYNPIVCIDYEPTPGTYHYGLQGLITGSGSVSLNNFQFIAYEL